MSYTDRHWETWRVKEVREDGIVCTEPEKPLGYRWFKLDPEVAGTFSVGDSVTIELYGVGFNPRHLGLWDRDGRCLQEPMSDEELYLEDECRRAENRMERVNYAQKWLERDLGRVSALPDWIRVRIDKFREEGGTGFILDGLPYELCIAELAVIYVRNGGEFDEEVRGYDNLHGCSGNQHDLALALARAHLQGQDLYGTVGGLSPITAKPYY